MSFSSFLMTCPAPWCGYTTLSPIMKSMHSISRLMSRSSIWSVSVAMMSSSFGSSACRTTKRLSLGLQVTVHEIDLLQPAKALADVLRTDLPHTLDGLELRVRRGEDLVEPTELAHDVLHDEAWQARDAAQNAEAAGRDGIVERVDLAVVAEQLGEPPEVKQVLVREPRDAVERDGEGVVHRVGEVVVQQRGLIGGDADHRLLELHLDQPALGAELDDVALDLDRHAGHELGALEDGEDVVEGDAALELERGQPGGDLVEAGAVLVEGRERLVGLGQDRGDLLEDVLGAVDVEGDDLAPLGDRDHE